LQICWDIVPGQHFFYIAQGVGWGIVAVLFTITMTITGVSFRFGEICHVNPNNSMADFWGPLLGISIAAALIQVLTFFYCIKVYLMNVFQDSPPATNGSSGLPSYHSSSVRTASARAVYQRVKKVLWLQWRSITIVFFVLIDIIFFAIVWVRMDNALQTARDGDLEHFLPFLTCLFINGEVGKKKCFDAGQKALANESTALAILMLLSVGRNCALSFQWLTCRLVDWHTNRSHDDPPFYVHRLVRILSIKTRIEARICVVGCKDGTKRATAVRTQESRITSVCRGTYSHRRASRF
jgi:hypothetical protein